MNAIEGKPERRASERRPLRRGCKLFHPSTHQYLSAETVDVSDGGALLVVRSTRPLLPGDPVRIVVAHDDECILSSALMNDAVVVRTADLRLDGQTVAIRFEDPSSMEPAYGDVA